MLFELKPNNRGLDDQALLDDLRGVACRLGKDYVTKQEYKSLGRVHPTTLSTRFGSWCKAHELAELRKTRNYNVNADDCIDDLKLVAGKLGKQTLLLHEYIAHGSLSKDIIRRRCGSFRRAIMSAGLAPSPLNHEKLTDEELFANLEHLWELLGKQPRRDDFVKPNSSFTSQPYTKRFGSYRKALEAFVASLETPQHQSSKPMSDELRRVSPPVGGSVSAIRHKTSRSISWRMRFLVMRRDNFRCVFCGKTQADLAASRILEVDHIVPWCEGGETVMDNLQTLCPTCNGGKSNLPMKEG